MGLKLFQILNYILKLTHMLTGLGVEVVVILVKSVEEAVLEVLIIAFHPSGVDRI